MSFNLGRYEFEGPLENINEIDEQEGVFAVICLYDEAAPHLVHIDEGENVKSKIRNHVKSTEWVRQCRGKLAFGINYTPNLRKRGREMIVDDIKQTAAADKNS